MDSARGQSLNQKPERRNGIHIRSGTNSNRESVGSLTGKGLVKQRWVSIPTEQVVNPKANYGLSVSRKLSLGKLNLAYTLEAALWLRYYTGVQFNQAFSHMRPSTADSSQNFPFDF